MVIYGQWGLNQPVTGGGPHCTALLHLLKDRKASMLRSRATANRCPCMPCALPQRGAARAREHIGGGALRDIR